jgi:Zn-finger nucleic acid-binding protein
MKCPNCDETLVMTDRQGIEIDYCPKCRGVWLDKGELDKIIERSGSLQSNQQLQQNEQDRRRRDDDDDDDDDDDNGGGLFNRGQKGTNRTGRRGGFLGNLFDFD